MLDVPEGQNYTEECYLAFGVALLHRTEGYIDNNLPLHIEETMPLYNVFQHDNNPKH